MASPSYAGHPHRNITNLCHHSQLSRLTWVSRLGSPVLPPMWSPTISRGLTSRLTYVIPPTSSLCHINALCCQPVLFLPLLLKSLHCVQGLESAVTFGRKFAHLPYFGHALEVLLLQALDEEDAVIRKRSRGHQLLDTNTDDLEHKGDSPTVGLAEIIQFLDHFPQSTTAVIACARKCEAELWPILFDVVGSPRDLFNVSLSRYCPLSAKR